MSVIKRLLGVLCITTFMLSLFALPAYARAFRSETVGQSVVTKISKDAARSIALNVMPEMGNDNVNINLIDYSGASGGRVWSFSWSPEDNVLGINENINIDADTGVVRSFTVNENYALSGKNFIPKYTREELRKIVEDKINELQPEQFKSVEYKEETGDNRYYITGMKAPIIYTFNYVRKLGNISYKKDGFKVSINSSDGVITSYEYTWSSSNLPNENSIMSMQQAQTEFLKYGKPRLMYIRPWLSDSSNENRNLMPVYSIVNGLYYFFNFNAISASSGKPVNTTGKEMNIYFEKVGSKYNPDADNVANALPNVLSEDEAKAVAEKEMKNYPVQFDNLDGLGVNYNDNWNGIHRKAYTFGGTKEVTAKDGDSEKIVYNIRISVDIETGNVLEFNYSKNNNAGETADDQKIPWGIAKGKAVDFVRNEFPQYSGNLVYAGYEPYNKKGDVSKHDYYFSFWRTVNDVLYPENNVNIVVDGDTSEIIGFSYRWEYVSFPAVDNTITEEAASDTFMNEVGLQINNRMSDDNNHGTIVYEVKPSAAAYIDAYTGKLKNAQGGDVIPVSQKSVLMNKIKYLREAMIFDDMGILDLDKDVNLYNNISLGQYLKILGMLKGNSFSVNSTSNAKAVKASPYDGYVKMAASLGWIKADGNLDANQEINYQTFADVLVKFMGYDEMASVDKIDSMTMLIKLGIIDGSIDSNKFVNMGDAIKSIYMAAEKSR